MLDHHQVGKRSNGLQTPRPTWPSLLSRSRDKALGGLTRGLGRQFSQTSYHM